MTNRNTILNELNELGSSLGTYNPQNLYFVPHGYFEGFPTQILNRIKALEAVDAKEELEYLSPLLGNISKESPYSVPSDYFQNFSSGMLQMVSEHADHLRKESFGQTSKEEIESLSPLLSGLKNKNPYQVPTGYFENIGAGVGKKETKVISITKRKWYRLAVAAIFIGVIAIGGLIFFAQRSVSTDNPEAWINKNVTKKVSEEKLDEFVTLINDDSNEKADDESDIAKQAEIKELMKDVSEKEIEDFLNDAVALESNTDTDGTMNE